MKKRVLSFALALLMAVEIPLSASATGWFNDVPDHEWYSAAIFHCAKKNYMSGEGHSMFRPNGKVSRGMVAQVLWNMSGKTEPTIQNPFTDVSNQWFAKAVIWAYENKITSGTSSTTFSPNANVTREQLCTLVMNWKKLDTSFTFDDDEVWLTNFKDKSSISGFAKKAMIWGYQTGFISGTSSTELSPKQGATRAQLAQFLYNLDNPKLRDKPTVTEPDPVDPTPVDPDPVIPSDGKNTHWTAELAPMQLTKAVRTSDSIKFMAPSEKSSEPIEWYVMPHYETGSGMLPYFDASKKDIKPIPAAGVVNTGDPYWTMLGCIPRGGYVENNRIYLTIGVADSDWIGERYYSEGHEYDNRKKTPKQYTWRVDVTSVDGKMTADEKQMFDIENQWRAEKGIAALIMNENIQMRSEAAALIQYAETTSCRAGAAELGIYSESEPTKPAGGSLHEITMCPIPASEASRDVVTFKNGFAVRQLVRDAYTNSEAPVLENMFYSGFGKSASGVMNNYRNSRLHYKSVVDSAFTVGGVSNIHTFNELVVSNCCEFDRIR